MDLRHQSNTMCVITLGEKAHTLGLQRKEENTYQPLSQLKCNNKKQLTNYPRQALLPSIGRNKCKKASLIYRFTKKVTIFNKLLQKQLCLSKFQEHRSHCRSEEPLRFLASKSCQFVDRRASECAFNRDAL